MNPIFKTVKNLFYRGLKPVSAALDLDLSVGVTAGEVREFLKKLHPVNPGIELIRVGPKGDGGYLVPNDLEGLTACFSPGVDLESRFELELAERGLDIFMADYSIEKPMIDHPKFHFSKKFLGGDDSGHYMRLDTWASQSLPPEDQSDLLLQMDIEGFEYDSILSLSRPLLDRFRIIVIELHDLERLFDRYFFDQFSRIFEKLLVNHTVVHLHPNNNFRRKRRKGIDIHPLLEITLLRKDRVVSSEYFTDFPHPLDEPNLDRVDAPLGKDWYRAK
jgi:hypothetical protein